MEATIFLALLSHPDRIGDAIGGPPVDGCPIHLSLHTSDQAAVEALDAAMIAEWDANYAAHLGPSHDWERARRSRRMVEGGYLAAVIERPVSLAGGGE